MLILPIDDFAATLPEIWESVQSDEVLMRMASMVSSDWHKDAVSDILQAMTSEIMIFDRAAVRTHRHRAAAMPRDGRFLVHEARLRLVDRLDDIKRRFPVALDLGCGDGELSTILADAGHPAQVVGADLAYTFAARAGGVVCDEEMLPFAAHSVDLVIAPLTLHWVNDLPGSLLQIRHILKPDGLLLAAMWGGETLKELRAALMQAEIETLSGASPRVSPFTDVRDAGGLLQRAGLGLPVVDSDILTVTYPDMFALIRDLRAMGETNAIKDRRRSFTPRATLLRAAAIYRERHGDAEGRITASFQLLTLTGWAPHESQQRPLKPGSGKISLAEALKTSSSD